MSITEKLRKTTKPAAITLATILLLTTAPGMVKATGEYKNHGECVSACVQDLGVLYNKVCTDMCKDGIYGKLESGSACTVSSECQSGNCIIDLGQSSGYCN